MKILTGRSVRLSTSEDCARLTAPTAAGALPRASARPSAPRRATGLPTPRLRRTGDCGPDSSLLYVLVCVVSVCVCV